MYKKLYEKKKKSAMKYLASVNKYSNENKFINYNNDNENNNYLNKYSNLKENFKEKSNLKSNDSHNLNSNNINTNNIIKVNPISNDILNKHSDLQTNSLNNETEDIKLFKDKNIEEDIDTTYQNNNIKETDFFKNYFARLSNKTLKKIKKNNNSNPPKKNPNHYINNIKGKKGINEHLRINSSNHDLMLKTNDNIKIIKNSNIVNLKKNNENNKINIIKENHEINNNIKNDEIEFISMNNKNNNEIEEKEKNTNLDDTNYFDKEYFTEKNNNLINNNNNNLQSSNSINNAGLNELTFKQSEKLDKRNLFFLSFNFITNKINIIKIICYSELYQFIPLLLSTYLFGILLDFTLNAFLYSDDVISKKYKNNGNLDFWTNEFLSMISKLIGFIISGIVVNLTEYSINLNFFVEEVKGNKKYYGKLLEYLKKINRKIIIFYIIENLFNLFFIYYLEVFCAIYQKSQTALFKTYLIGELTGFLYTIVIAIIIALLRYISLKCSKKRIFIISQYLDNKTS